MEGEQRWEANNGNTLETWGHLHRMEHKVSSGDNSVSTKLVWNYLEEKQIPQLNKNKDTFDIYRTSSTSCLIIISNFRQL